MNHQNLTQYLFWDGHEEIANQKGKLVAIRDSKQGATNYLPLKRTRYVHGSTPNIYSRKISREPQKGEQLITSSWFFGLFQGVSHSRIKQIDKSFRLPKNLNKEN